MVGYLFGKGQEYATPAELAKARAIANAMLANSRAPRDVGEGISALGDGIVTAVLNSRADASEKSGMDKANAAFNPILAALGGSSAFPAAPSSKVAKALAGPADNSGDQLAWTDAKPYQKALLNTISGPESGGRYDIIYGGGKFDDFSHHPNRAVRIQTGPNAGRTSSAAGKYQFLGSTWDQQAKELGLPDFSPANQDKAAWNLAAETYKAQTGQVLDDVLQSGDPAAIANVGKVLSGTWTSLPGGIEQGTNTNRFVATYQKALGAGATPEQAQQAAAQEQGPVQVASLDPSAGFGRSDPYAKIPATDGMGQDQRAKFRQWNSDPIANNAANMGSIDPAMARVVARAKQIAGTDFVIGSGKRSPADQRKAIEFGWSGTENSDHLTGGAADLWPIDKSGAVVFDPQKQQQIVAAMKQAANELGVDMEAGADWRKKDVPHFGMVGQTPMQGPIPEQRPGDVQVASNDPSAGMGAAATAPQGPGQAGEIRQGADGRSYQYVQTTGMAGATGDQGWIPVNPDALQPGPAGGPGAVTPAGQRVFAAMMNPQPMTGGPAPMPMQGPQGGAFPPAPPPPQAQAASPVAQALFGKPAAPQQQMTAQTDPSMIPAAAGGTADTFDASQGPSMQQLYNALQQPFLSDEQKDIIGAEIQRKQQEADPLRQLQIQAARKSLAVPPKQWQKLDDNTLFDPASGETKQIGAAGPTKFEGTGLDAQAWNILQSADPSSREYATAYAIISQPKTQLVQTENGLVPVQVPPTLPAWLKAPGGGPAAPVGNSPSAPPAAPAPAAPAPARVPPAAAPMSAPAPAPAPPGSPAAGAAIPGTMKAPTEAQLRNQQLYQVAAPELKIVEDNFDALSNLRDQAWSAIPGSDNYGANYMQTPQYQRAKNSLQTIIATYLYSTSGATANPGEVANQASVLMPKPGEDPTSVADKRARIRTMVDAIKTAGGGQPGAAPSDAKSALKQKYGLD